MFAVNANGVVIKGKSKQRKIFNLSHLRDSDGKVGTKRHATVAHTKFIGRANGKPDNQIPEREKTSAITNYAVFGRKRSFRVRKIP